ncbi:ABC transporter permease [Risungbinella massiliensis]|uniref:ABC transporter permease n=1 Tax=Risungbinella massiliensis TaxID=1329796 RepID=UPI0005CB9F44|nr:ABC transporter permease [Risungbinella massiliensis]
MNTSLVNVAVLGLLAVIVLTLLTSYVRHRYEWNMAIRNLKLHRTTSVFTIVASTIGTALITAALLFQSSIQTSIDHFLEQKYGQITIVIDGVKPTSGFQYPFQTREINEIKGVIQKRPEIFQGILPTVAIYGTLQSQIDGKVKNTQPKVYLQSFSASEAKRFQPIGTKEIPETLSEQQVIVSEKLANQLQTKKGEKIFLQVPNQEPVELMIEVVLPEKGLTGFRGVDKGSSTAIISETLARKITGISSGYTHLLIANNPELGLDSISLSNSPDSPWNEQFTKAFAKIELEGIEKFTPFFLVSSVTAILVGLLLVRNIFRMILEERRQELGVLRAMGFTRGQVAGILRKEGILYAITSSTLGVVLGIGFSYAVLAMLKDTFAMISQYESFLDVQFEFHLSLLSCSLPFGIGLFFIYFCMLRVSHTVTKTEIISLLQPIQVESIKVEKISKARILISVLLGIAAMTVAYLGQSNDYQTWLAEKDQEVMLLLGNLIVGLGVIVLTIAFVLVGYPVVLQWIERCFRGRPKLYQTLRLFFRYPLQAKKRSAYLLILFTSVMFLLGLSSVVNGTLSPLLEEMSGKNALGGYHLLAQTREEVLPETKEEIARLKVENLKTTTQVTQWQLENFMGANLNGVEKAFMEIVQIPLKSKATRFTTDRQAWQELGHNPKAIIVSEMMVVDEHGNYPKVGDILKLKLPSGIEVEKEVIALAKYEGTMYGYGTSSGIFLQKEEVDRLSKGSRGITTYWLFEAGNEKKTGVLYEKLQQKLNTLGIYQLKNPELAFVAGLSFTQIILGLLEAFSGLATVVGICGLMTILYRVIRERRQQLGMLRAVGMEKKHIWLGVIMEGSVLAMQGILLGLTLGAYVGYLLLTAVFSGEPGSTTIELPISKLVLYFGVAYFITIICSCFPAKASMRYTPAEATRYAS